MSAFAQKLASGTFVVTGELNPPKGTDLVALMESGAALKGWVDAVNLTDSHTARMTMSPVAPAVRLQALGLETILQITGRDRNRIAVQADLLSAHELGLHNVVCMSGDDPAAGDHPDAKAVFDLEAIGLLQAVQALNQGCDLGASELAGSTTFCAGAVANPCAKDLNKEIQRVSDKVAAGAQFFQTQPIFDIAHFEPFIEATHHLDTRILAGIMPLKSVKMAMNLNANVPGIDIPDKVINTLEQADDLVTTSLEIAAQMISHLMGTCAGVHIMAIGWDRHIPKILDQAGVSK